MGGNWELGVIMKSQTHVYYLYSTSSARRLSFLVTLTLFIFSWANNTQAEAKSLPPNLEISVLKLSDEKAGFFGYKLQYIVPVPIDVYWRFKTDFDNEIISTSAAIAEHKFIRSVGNNYYTENRFSASPGTRFVWQTTVYYNKYHLEFRLVNAKEIRHEFHFGSIQLSPAGKNTFVTQRAYFNFRGASFWVRYPWYGGMKSTLTSVAKWEQKTARKHMRLYQTAIYE